MQLSPVLLTREELAPALSVSPRVVDALKRRGKIPYLKIGRRVVRYDLNSVLAALNKYEVKAIGI